MAIAFDLSVMQKGDRILPEHLSESAFVCWFGFGMIFIRFGFVDLMIVAQSVIRLLVR